MVSQRDLQELVGFQGDGALVLSLYLDTDLNRQPKDQCKLFLRERLREVADKGLHKDAQKVIQFFDYEYNWQGRAAAVFSCQERGFWRAYSLAVPTRNLVFVAETPYVKPLTDLLDEYGQYGVVLVDQEGARLFAVQLGEIQEASGIYGQVVKRHKQGGWSQKAYQKRVDMQVLHNVKMTVEATTEFCKGQGCKALILAGTGGTVAQFRDLLPKKLQKLVVGTISADMNTSSDAVLERSMAVWLAAKHKEEDALVEQAITAATKGGAGVIGLADTMYAIRQGRVQTLLLEQGYETPGALCDHCGYVIVEKGPKCLFCGSEMRDVDNAVDLAVQRALEAGGKVITLVGNEKLVQAGHIGAILRY